MYVVELKTGRWICSENKLSIEHISGKFNSQEELDNVKNLWYQPWNYLSGVMSDFFWSIKDGVKLEQSEPMRGWHNDLPLSECIKGNVEYIGNKAPKWYSELLTKGYTY